MKAHSSNESQSKLEIVESDAVQCVQFTTGKKDGTLIP